MDRRGHLIASEFILVMCLCVYLIISLREYGTYGVFISTIWSIGTYLFGCILPDFDHPNVQEKMIVIKWLKNITKHRGHWHSLVAMSVYGALILYVMWLFQIVFWQFPVISGMLGFFSHLVEDDLNRYKLKSKPERGVKVW